jgi:hypothetical protein
MFFLLGGQRINGGAHLAHITERSGVGDGALATLEQGW